MAQPQPQSPACQGWETVAMTTIETFLQKHLDRLREGIGMTDGFIWQLTESPLVKIGCYSSITPPIPQNLLTLWREMVQASDPMLRQGQLLAFPSSQPILSHFQKAQDSDEVFSLLLVPLRLRKFYLGGICLYNRYQKHHWSDEELDFVQTVATQCALALEQIQADSTDCRWDLLTLLSHKLATAPEMTSEFTSEFTHCLQLVGEHFQLNWVILGYLETDRLSIGAEWIRDRLGVAEAIQAILDGQELGEAMLKGGFYQSHSSTLSASPEVGESHSIVAFPLVLQGNLLGSLVLPTPQMINDFAPQDLQTLTLIADRLAIALFHQHLQQRIESLEADNQRLQAASQTKSDYLSHLHHELRTPLTGVLGFAKMLREELYGPLNDKQKQYISGIVNSGQHLLALVNDFLDLSKIEADREELWLETVAVEDICLAAISMIQVKATEQKLDLRLTIAQDVDFCTLDQRRIKQILLNLLSNAIKFTEKGSVTLKVQRENQMLTFSIIDTGIGIKSEDQTKLFAPFGQIYNCLSRKHKGTGLGLALSRELARLHGGDLTVTSQEGQGSCFTLYLPTQPVSEVKDGEI